MRVQLIHQSALAGEAISYVLQRRGHKVFMQKNSSFSGDRKLKGIHLLILDITANPLVKPILNNLNRHRCSLVLLGRISQLHYLLTSRSSKWSYVTKRESLLHLLECIARAPFNRSYLSGGILDFLELPNLQQQRILFKKPISEPVTRTELRVLNEIASGHTTRQVADKMYRSIYTISNHRKNMMQKLGLKGPFALGTFSAKHLDSIRTLNAIQTNQTRIEKMILANGQSPSTSSNSSPTGLPK